MTSPTAKAQYPLRAGSYDVKRTVENVLFYRHIYGTVQMGIHYEYFKEVETDNLGVVDFCLKGQNKCEVPA